MQTGLIYSTVLLDWNQKLMFVCDEVQLRWASPIPGRGNPAQQTPPALKCHSQAEKKPLFLSLCQAQTCDLRFWDRDEGHITTVHDQDVLNRPYNAYFRISSWGNVPLNPTDAKRAPWSHSLGFGMY